MKKLRGNWLLVAVCRCVLVTQENVKKTLRSRRVLLVCAWILSIGSLQQAPLASAASYAIVGLPGWTEGSFERNCGSATCAITSFAPNGDGSFQDPFWNSGPLPLGHYYWRGSAMVFYCKAGQWLRLAYMSGYFDYDPRTGDQSVVAGDECGASSPSPETPNPDTGKPECNSQVSAGDN